jgi:hypothetical protein
MTPKKNKKQYSYSLAVAAGRLVAFLEDSFPIYTVCLVDTLLGKACFLTNVHQSEEHKR